MRAKWPTLRYATLRYATLRDVLSGQLAPLYAELLALLPASQIEAERKETSAKKLVQRAALTQDEAPASTVATSAQTAAPEAAAQLGALNSTVL